ncbi:MAG: hypothetical protein ACJ75F_11335 [Flavisolibacter sp.]|jgi:hypothetical protein
MKKRFLLMLAIFAACFNAMCQENEDQKYSGQTSFYAEVGGPGILFSANYDRRFHNTNLGVGMRIGLGFVTTYEDYYDSTRPYYYYGHQRSVVTVPFQVNYIFGKPNSPHTFEVGGGVTVLSKKVDVFNYYEEEPTNLYATFSFMYRRQPKNGGFSWRIGFTPLISKGYIQPSGAVSLGYNF